MTNSPADSGPYLVASIRSRTVALLLVIATLAFSCGDAESFIVTDTEPDQVLSSVRSWADRQRMVSINCDEHGFDRAISGSCFESTPPGADPHYFIFSAQEAGGIATTIFISQASKQNRERLKDELRKHLIAAFGDQDVSREN